MVLVGMQMMTTYAFTPNTIAITNPAPSNSLSSLSSSSPSSSPSSSSPLPSSQLSAPLGSPFPPPSLPLLFFFPHPRAALVYLQLSIIIPRTYFALR